MAKELELDLQLDELKVPINRNHSMIQKYDEKFLNISIFRNKKYRSVNQNKITFALK